MPESASPAPGTMPLKLLFVCTHNRCRSILCEALARHLGGGRVAAFSAGSRPAGEVHPDTIAKLAARGIDTRGLISQSWDDFADLAPDAVITVCDDAAAEPCPVWMGPAIKVHWGLPDPSRITEGPLRDAAFAAVMDTIEDRLRRLLEAGDDTKRGDSLRRALAQLA